jgi:hypothetical protein
MRARARPAGPLQGARSASWRLQTRYANDCSQKPLRRRAREGASPRASARSRMSQRLTSTRGANTRRKHETQTVLQPTAATMRMPVASTQLQAAHAELAADRLAIIAPLPAAQRMSDYRPAGWLRRSYGRRNDWATAFLPARVRRSYGRRNVRAASLASVLSCCLAVSS